MKGIQIAFTGRVGVAAEIKTSKAGKPWAAFSVVVDGTEGDEEGRKATWVRVVLFGDLAARLAPRLTKGVDVYVEGTLKLDEWNGKDGVRRAGLSVAAWKAEPLGQIGFKRLKPEAGATRRALKRCRSS